MDSTVTRLGYLGSTISSMASQRAAVLRAIPSFLEASRTDSPSLRTMRRNLLSVPTLITPARSCLKNGQDMRLTWLRIRREFASDWLSFQNESTRIHPFETAVLGFQLFDALELVGRHPGIFGLPLVIGGIADPVLAADLCHRQSGFTFAQDRNDLTLREFRLPHRSFLQSSGSLYF